MTLSTWQPPSTGLPFASRGTEDLLGLALRLIKKSLRPISDGAELVHNYWAEDGGVSALFDEVYLHGLGEFAFLFFGRRPKAKAVDEVLAMRLQTRTAFQEDLSTERSPREASGLWDASEARVVRTAGSYLAPPEDTSPEWEALD